MKIYYTEIRQIKTTLIEAHTVGSRGWRSGESARLPPMLPGSKSRLRLHMWVEFVVGALSCSKRFFSGYSGFPLSSKTNICEFKFNKESGRLRTTLWMCYLIFIYLFIYMDTVKPRFTDTCLIWTALIITDSLLCPWGNRALTFSINSTRLIGTLR